MAKARPPIKALPIPLPRPCPGCTEKQRTIRALADILAGTAGAVVGSAAGTYYGGPQGGLVGAELGQEIAPYLIEDAALSIAGAAPKIKRKASAYSKKFGKAFKKIQKKHKMKKGCWKKGGYKRCVREAHKLAKKMR
jgi:hypothetical protein